MYGPSGARRRATLWVGTSGYEYDHWAGRFYPRGLPRRRWFEHYAQHFDTVEVNATFYRLPTPPVFDAWRARAPAGFLYAVKYSRYGSHMKHLRDPQAHLDVFLERALRLGPTLGPVLVQLPPRWRADAPRLSGFLARVPARLRVAVEFRDPSWLCDEVYAVLRRHRAALCVHDAIARHPRVITAGWTYLRFHGPRGDYRGSYSRQKLSATAGWIRSRLDEGLDVHAYFDNDERAFAARNAADLARYVAGRN